MKNKYSNYYDLNDVSIDYGQYINITDYIKEYGDWTTYDPETKEERLAREKAEKRNDKIDQILG
jgi:hypothetical protein